MESVVLDANVFQAARFNRDSRSATIGTFRIHSAWKWRIKVCGKTT
jgi:hypothetical protein